MQAIPCAFSAVLCIYKIVPPELQRDPPGNRRQLSRKNVVAPAIITRSAMYKRPTYLDLNAVYFFYQLSTHEQIILTKIIVYFFETML